MTNRGTVPANRRTRSVREWLAEVQNLPTLVLGATVALWLAATLWALLKPGAPFIVALSLAGSVAGPLGMAFALYVYAVQEQSGREQAEDLNQRLSELVDRMEDLDGKIFGGDRSLSSVVLSAEKAIADVEVRTRGLLATIRQEFGPLLDDLRVERQSLKEQLRDTEANEVRTLVAGGRGCTLDEICRATGMRPKVALGVLQEIGATFSDKTERWHSGEGGSASPRAGAQQARDATRATEGSVTLPDEQGMLGDA